MAFGHQIDVDEGQSDDLFWRRFGGMQSLYGRVVVQVGSCENAKTRRCRQATLPPASHYNNYRAALHGFNENMLRAPKGTFSP